MNLFNFLLSIISLSLILVDPALGAKSTATSFCKCICFTNSTIIALNPPPSSTSASAVHNLALRSPHALAADSTDEQPAPPSRPHHKLTCADCTRAFCLDYNLPICKNARDEDVFTTCFQRDSLKDETVVVIFIFATAGLLAWAIVKPWIDRLREKNTFAPLLPHNRGVAHIRGQNHGQQSNSRGGPRRTPGFGDGTRGEGDEDDLVGIGSRSRNGKGARREGDGAPNHIPYDEDMHADQDAMDIVSGMPSGSGSRP
ncbi:uncharacterized protein Z520_03397 [Fonsecaea multimorphosa CBS 102226]|uniref:Uncharacterized protein n=1 Tax=Fonsecaea multimorphosa CBS 102226 TaxID=1442371 RepID=A0A0D2IUJ7_9EURO|nr:uncharacterized protein Z520_03397 [Fonsecaea multimorphosa CBS 102226]KIY00732.1 hypothetical protein Z520_03397 [Fonsecaea multimorphosa CBS 102226]OAL27776.1 hypothetical protein AYO22_03318 [Fonsecaea multimorphosa]